MADTALVLLWDRVVPGREKQALALFGQTLEYYGTLQKDGAIESYEPVLFDPNGKDVNGLILIRGSADQLDALRRQDRFIELTMQGTHQCENFGMVGAHLEGQLQARMAKWAQIISQ
ncbi:MAG: hypothetical protein WBM48_15955 [Polyangiales bacterium]|jgi:hypothetical protein